MAKITHKSQQTTAGQLSEEANGLMMSWPVPQADFDIRPSVCVRYHQYDPELKRQSRSYAQQQLCIAACLVATQGIGNKH